jgi:hypothetical protein
MVSSYGKAVGKRSAYNSGLDIGSEGPPGAVSILSEPGKLYRVTSCLDSAIQAVLW